MRGRYQIYIVGALFGKFKEYIAKALLGYFDAKSAVGNISVLTKNAAKSAVGEKHCSGAVSAGNAGFFPMMQGSARNFK